MAPRCDNYPRLPSDAWASIRRHRHLIGYLLSLLLRSSFGCDGNRPPAISTPLTTRDVDTFSISPPPYRAPFHFVRSNAAARVAYADIRQWPHNAPGPRACAPNRISIPSRRVFPADAPPSRQQRREIAGVSARTVSPSTWRQRKSTAPNIMGRSPDDTDRTSGRKLIQRS